MKKLSLLFAVVLVCVLAFTFSWTENTDAQAFKVNPQGEARRQAVFAELIQTAQQTGEVRVIVRLQNELKTIGNLQKSEIARHKSEIKQSQGAFLTRHKNRRIEKVTNFEFIPFVAFETDAATLEQMKNDPNVISIEKDEFDEPHLAESTEVIGAPTSWTSGFSGLGQNIVILDTGVDKTHPFLAGKVVSEACFSTNASSQGVESLCPGGVTQSTAEGSGVNCDPAITSCSHGTHVAGIAAGRGQNFSGVAKDANIIAMQVFSKGTTSERCSNGTPPCTISVVSDQIRALERVLALSSTMSIASVNMSLGSGQFETNCDVAQAARKAAIDNLRSVGIATVVSSGNSGYSNATSAPACISSVISVGSTDDGSLGTTTDSISNFSNSAAHLSILAPGRWITSSIAGGGYSSYSGTSMAAPHVAGAFAVLRQRMPNAPVPRLLNAMTSTGQGITDTRNDLSKPRLKIVEASNAAARNNTVGDFDGDGKTDLAIFRPSAGEWWYLRSGDGSSRAFQFGLSTDKIVPADYTGDGKTDVAFFRPSTNEWFILRSEDSSFYSAPFGAAGDIPAPADFDGDGKTDLAVFRPSEANWYINRSSGGFSILQFGAAGDIPMAADYDGDGKADLAIYRQAVGEWWLLRSSDGGNRAFQFGTAADKPVPADYTGDGKTDVAFFRPATSEWFVLRSEDSSFYSAPFGASGDVPIPGDFDGDGKADVAVWRPTDTNWYVVKSTGSFSISPFGANGDKPIPSAFIP